ncbi:bifunctional deaminase-reductase domain protein [Pseudarthrobacter chlorophenolicus A6]|uniref:Bifunctional deaminase-reductase domain protein n=1 Tax=Pseudarthrobacter chlorophenolicus (strain ATCC 700700 / DSM 12829 / CIP 107037 / JCM 12360 / KCTC 9906 / NCIMB 13794 / A6) TaxID=452863 RepID=B8HD68_PSECP|nr:dihydrofolate reductase family protein [Pseudarthrobacter chlorophenolicus]ACL40714.1 bifunctional deaminase-reductase domain protein [Pseudarthrobacter chlorophenolicus A6]SDQ76400.1 Dihydrofolate reductase [Pseudarthrobacter chlorophenolicus]
MAQLIYSGLISLDGYLADRDGNFDWSVPDEEVHAFVNDLERDAGTYLYGRRMYEVMSAWETFGAPPSDEAPVIQDYSRIWRAADKIVYSTTLERPATPRTRIERRFDPEAVQMLKDGADGTIGIGGATIAVAALTAGLVDECQVFVSPVVVGGGLRFFPEGLELNLELLEERRFGNGVMYLRYRSLSGNSG